MLVAQWTKITGGPTTYVFNLTKHLRSLGCKIEILCPEHSPDAYYYDNRLWLRWITIVLKLVKLKPNIIHIHGRLNHIIPALIYKNIFSRKSIIIFTFHTQPTIQSFDPECKEKIIISYSGLLGIIGSILIKFTDQVTSVSGSIIENINTATRLFVPNGYIVIPSGADPTKFVVSSDNKLSKHFEISTIGVTMYDWKYSGHVISIQAINILRSKINNIRLNIIGDGVYTPKLKKLVSSLGINEYVRFLGNRSDINDLLSNTRIYIHMALNEGCSLGIIEAMMAGKPVIVSNCGGNPEIVTNNYTGIVIEPSQYLLADAIERLYNDLELMSSLSKNAAFETRRNHNWNLITLKYFELFCKLVDIKK